MQTVFTFSRVRHLCGTALRRFFAVGPQCSRVEFRALHKAVIELRDFAALKKELGWGADPWLQDPAIWSYDYPEDANERRIRDAEVLGGLARNTAPAVCVEIGTAEGHGTALLAENAPQATVYTVNIPPEEVATGTGGVFTTMAMERERTGIYFREKGLTNIRQIFANSACWQPDFGPIDLAFIDGCHDADFVYNDTRTLLRQMRSGGFIAWHDFCPAAVCRYAWVHSVCSGIERLFREKLLTGRILHVRNSWMGVYRVP